MSTSAEHRIYRYAAIFVILLALALVLPRFFASQEGGFAGGAGSVLVFLLMLVGVSIFSLVPFAQAVRSFSSLSVPARIAGLGPAIIMVIGLVTLWAFLRY